MFVALLRLDLRLPDASSLKDKRSVVKGLAAALRLRGTEVVLVLSHEVTVTDPVFMAFVDTLSATIEAMAPAIVQP